MSISSHILREGAKSMTLLLERFAGSVPPGATFVSSRFI
jgi:hypothetical protein